MHHNRPSPLLMAPCNRLLKTSARRGRFPLARSVAVGFLSVRAGGMRARGSRARLFSAIVAMAGQRVIMFHKPSRALAISAPCQTFLDALLAVPGGGECSLDGIGGSDLFASISARSVGWSHKVSSAFRNPKASSAARPGAGKACSRDVMKAPIAKIAFLPRLVALPPNGLQLRDDLGQQALGMWVPQHFNRLGDIAQGQALEVKSGQQRFQRFRIKHPLIAASSDCRTMKAGRGVDLVFTCAAITQAWRLHRHRK